MLLRVCQYTKCHINQYWYIMVYQCHGIVSLYLSYLFFVTFQIHCPLKTQIILTPKREIQIQIWQDTFLQTSYFFN